VPTITEVPIDSQVNSGVTDAETMLDIAVASAVANSAAIAVYFAPLNAQGILHALHAMVHPLAGQPVPTVISISYSWDFDDLTNLLSDDDYSQLSKLFRDAADLWITTLASTGDSGATWGTSRAYACFPATDPNVLACGGTTVGPLKMGIDSFDEYVWNDAKGTTGGGVSDRFGIPSYQTALTLPVQINTSKTGRGTPDVSGNASPNSGYTLFIGGISSGWGGTSAVAPLYAGLVAIVNEQLKAAGSLYPAGFINSLLYEQAATLCRDVTAAAGPTNNGFSGGPGYTAGIGWDACTGLGSIRGNQLLHAIRPLTCQIVYKKSDNCDQGPLENTVAVFLAEITGGAGPFNYAWVPGNAAPPPGGSLTGQKVSIAVPPAGTTFTLTLTVTDISLIPVTVTASFVSLNPEVAGIGHALCEFIHWGYEFKQPIYISPGDPYRNGIFTLQELINLHAAATRVANLTGSLLKNRLTFETGELQGVIL
jgi:hypothetical protein